MARIAVLTLLCLALPGCTVTLFGNQSSGGGAATTTTSSRVDGSARFAGGQASISSGQPVSPNAQGGQVTFFRGASVLLILGLAIADTVNYFGTRAGKRPAPDEAISQTCSCYGYTPPATSGE